MDSISSMDSAGSCDSMISVNSTFSESSLEHLSAEERACLMFLEETIESLEAEDDSGVSSDELKRPSVQLPYPSSHRSKQDGALKPLLQSREMKEESGASFDDNVTPPLVLVDGGQSVSTDKFDAIPVPPAFASVVHISRDKVDTANMPKTSAGSQTNHTPQSIPSEMNIVLIPPPSDFQDEPTQQTEQQVTRQPPVRIDLEQFRKRASIKKAPVATSETSAKPLPADQASQGSSPPSPLEIHAAHHHDLIEPRTSPPAVAPKPKKLPPNIVMKTHRTSDPNGSSPLTSPSERVMMDPQKVRLEALRKLGLLKDAHVDPGSPTSPLHSPNFLRSREAQSPPATPPVTSLLPTWSTTSQEISVPQSRPSPPSRHCEYSESDVPTATVQPVIKLPEVKATSLESLGTANQVFGDSLYGSSAADGAAAASQSFGATKPRPASLGNRRDFIVIQGDAPLPGPATKVPELGDVGKSAAPAPPAQILASHKPPRSQGISVLISPRGENGGNRREALKKLGLLKD